MTPRLVKVTVVPMIVLEDDDGNLEEVETQPIVVPARDWPTFSSKAWPQLLDDLREGLEAKKT